MGFKSEPVVACFGLVFSPETLRSLSRLDINLKFRYRLAVLCSLWMGQVSRFKFAFHISWDKPKLIL
jgi:hypothetical protein